MQAVRGKMMPDPRAVPKHDGSGNKPVLAAGQPCQLISRLITACRLAKHDTIQLQYLVGSQQQLSGDKLM